MVKKLKQMAEKQAASSKSGFDSALAGAVKESAQQIWLAGMGAFAKAQAEGGKVFETLVKEGVSLQRKTQSVAEGKISEVTSKVSNMASMAGEVGAKAGQQWDKLESIFEERVARSLNKLGVPSAKDVNVLIARIDLLSKQVAQLSKAKPTAAAKTAAKKSSKPATKKTVRKTA
jgi:poly(hydroxyalkanoate) granule-associated protein